MSETWRTYYGGEPCQVGTTRGGKHVRIADFDRYEDAVAAVLARNSHDDLLDALTKCAVELEECADDTAGTYREAHFRELAQMARAAIAKVGGTE